MLRVKGTDVCKTCVYGGDYSEGCSYIAVHKKSRLIENGKRYNPEFCTKYKEYEDDFKKQRKEKWHNGKYF